MNLNEAIDNINRVLFVGRIELPEGPLTAQEHQELAGNLSLLVSRAQLADKLEDEKRASSKFTKLEDMPEAPGEKIEAPGPRNPPKRENHNEVG